jgi:hypothetical protein
VARNLFPSADRPRHQSITWRYERRPVNRVSFSTIEEPVHERRFCFLFSTKKCFLHRNDARRSNSWESYLYFGNQNKHEKRRKTWPETDIFFAGMDVLIRWIQRINSQTDKTTKNKDS